MVRAYVYRAKLRLMPQWLIDFEVQILGITVQHLRSVFNGMTVQT
mgnify:CR=1 FL=1